MARVIPQPGNFYGSWVTPNLDGRIKGAPGTQERLMTRIVEPGAGYPQIEALDIALRRRPVLSGSGTFGVRLVVDAEAVAALRSDLPGQGD